MLSPRRALILVSFAVELRRAFGETGRTVRSHRHQLRSLTTCLACTRLGRCLDALHPVPETSAGPDVGQTTAEVMGYDNCRILSGCVETVRLEEIAVDFADPIEAPATTAETSSPDGVIRGDQSSFFSERNFDS